jgi:hypothetical protein
MSVLLGPEDLKGLRWDSDVLPLTDVASWACAHTYMIV